MISIKSSGSFNNLERYLKRNQKINIRPILDRAGKKGVAALASATPRESGLAASSWDYHIETTHTGLALVWTNNDTENGFPVVIALQYGYATGTGGYVQGRDFINPAIRPIFDQIADEIWKAVTNG